MPAYFLAILRPRLLSSFSLQPRSNCDYSEPRITLIITDLPLKPSSPHYHQVITLAASNMPTQTLLTYCIEAGDEPKKGAITDFEKGFCASGAVAGITHQKIADMLGR